MVKLSDTGNELLKFLTKRYIDNGYSYSGCYPYNALIDNGFNKDVIYELVDAGYIQRRNCEAFAYELSVPERHRLLSEHSLCSRWFEKAGTAFLVEIRAEVQDVSLVERCAHDSNKFTVDTVKVVGDDSKPDKKDVVCPFLIGQVISLEYDLPSKSSWAGYAHTFLPRTAVAVGEFMVTDVVCNLLVDPPVNMIEVQSLSEEFNKIHSDSRTMALFEDVVLKRVKDMSLSLNDVIDKAVAKSEQQVHNDKTDVEMGKE